MTTVLDALEDFHYNLLTSDITFSDAGKLHLKTALRGYNPAFENGRIINFNLDIEEDINALLASLRLSREIEDRVDQRIQNAEREQ